MTVEIDESLHSTSAGRLAAILRKLRVCAGPKDEPRSNNDGTGYAIWGKVFDLQPPFEEVDLYVGAAHAADVFRLIQNVRNDLLEWSEASHQNLTEVREYLDVLDKIQELVSPLRLGLSNYAEQVSKLQSAEILCLSSLSSAFSAVKLSSPKVDESQLKEILGFIEELIERVGSTPMADGLKEFLLIQLDAIASAIRRYFIFGLASLQGELPRLLALLQMLVEEEDADTPEVSDVKRSISQVAGNLSQITLTVVTKAPALITGLNYLNTLTGSHFPQLPAPGGHGH